MCSEWVCVRLRFDLSGALNGTFLYLYKTNSPPPLTFMCTKLFPKIDVFLDVTSCNLIHGTVSEEHATSIFRLERVAARIIMITNSRQ
jgi:hypothetical protein